MLMGGPRLIQMEGIIVGRLGYYCACAIARTLDDSYLTDSAAIPRGGKLTAIQASHTHS